jgi:hypothetical protein
MLDGPFLEVVQHLVARRKAGARERGQLLEIVDVEITHAPRTNLAAGAQLLERCHGLREGVRAAPMQQITIEPVGLQARERSLARRDGSAPRGVGGQHLRDQEYLVPPSFDGASHQGFRGSRAIHLRRVEVTHAQIEAMPQGIDRIARRLLRVPGALADRGHARAARTEDA